MPHTIGKNKFQIDYGLRKWNHTGTKRNIAQFLLNISTRKHSNCDPKSRGKRRKN